MIALVCLLLTLLASPFKSRSRLEAENAALRRQLLILRRKVRSRVRLKNGDRLFFIQLYRWFPSILKSISRLSARRPSCAGTGPASAGTGGGNPAPFEAGRTSTRTSIEQQQGVWQAILNNFARHVEGNQKKS